jgi:putative acetyltransferase
VNIRKAQLADRDHLLDVWLRSVRATHTFLTEADIQHLLPLVREHALPNLELWCLCADKGVIAGFMGLHDNSIEALFITPEHLRKGGGKLLLEHASKLKGIPLKVDVNEQNPAAVSFYVANGFRVVGRSPLDGGGRPFPLLHMRRDE